MSGCGSWRSRQARLLIRQREAGALEEALQTALRLVALDPLQEAVHRSLMRLYAEMGRRGSALQQYQLCVGILARELGVEPEEESRRLYEEILSRRPPEPSAGATDQTAPQEPGTSMAADAPLTGRDQEMTRLRAMLAEADRGQGRMMVLLGEAGVGKSRLVGELATVAHALGRRTALRLGDLDLRIVATDILLQTLVHCGEHERVVELATDNLAALPAERVNDSFGRYAPPSIYGRISLVRGLAELGRFDEAARYADEAVVLADPTRHAYSIGMAHWNAGTLDLAMGDWARARERIEHGIAALRTAGASLAVPGAIAGAAWALAQLGRAEEALTCLAESEQLAEALAARDAPGGARGTRLHVLGRACLVLGRLDEAQSLAERAIEASPQQPAYAAHAWHLLGDVATHADRFDSARALTCYRETLVRAEPRGMRPLIAHCYLGIGRVHGRLGKRDTAGEHLARAVMMYRDMGLSYWLDQADAEQHAQWNDLPWRFEPGTPPMRATLSPEGRG